MVLGGAAAPRPHRADDTGPASGGRWSRGPAASGSRTDLGAPILESDRIPVPCGPPAPRVIDHPLTSAGETVRVTATSLGNPHCAVFLDAPADDARLRRLGPLLETHPFFPRRTNVEFVTVPRRASCACASGSAASATPGPRAPARRAPPWRPSSTGGGPPRHASSATGDTLAVEWPEGGHVRQVGEVELVFEGEWLDPAPVVPERVER